VAAVPSGDYRQQYTLCPRSSKSHVEGKVELSLRWLTVPLVPCDCTPFAVVKEHTDIVWTLLRDSARDYDGDRTRCWPGAFPVVAEHLIRQHALQHALTPWQAQLARWDCLIRYHVDEGVDLVVVRDALKVGGSHGC